MSENTIIWSVWISETNKVISTKQIPNSKEIQFKSKELAIEAVNKLNFDCTFIDISKRGLAERPLRAARLSKMVGGFV